MHEEHRSTARALFVEPFLVAASDPTPEPTTLHDEARDLTVLDDGTPLVEATTVGGTETMTKILGERDDVDRHMRLAGSAGTLTETRVRAEREDDEAPVAWGGTQLDTRRFPGDVEQDVSRR